MVILGDIFVKNYYAIFDFDHSTLGLNGLVIPYTEKAQPEDPLISFWGVVAILIIALAIIIPIAVFFYFKKKRIEQEQKLSLIESFHMDKPIAYNVNNSTAVDYSMRSDL